MSSESFLEYIGPLLSMPVGPFTFGELLLSFSIILATMILRGILIKVLFARLHAIAEKTKFTYDDRFLSAIEKPLSAFILVLGLFLSIIVLPLDAEWEDIIGKIYRGSTILLFFWALMRCVDIFIDVLGELSEKSGTDTLRGFGPLIKKSLRIFLIVIGVVMVIDNLGYNIGGIIATLGIGGAAFAFASKDTIANLYGSVALALDRPFKVGDWIQVGDRVDGDVEEIGLRSTKIRTWPKTVISIPNAVLANEIIDNWSRMPKRRVKQVVGVTYETSPDTMVALVESIRQLLRDDPGVNQEFILVTWTDFGASSLDILVYYFTSTIKWVEHMETRQRINVKIAKAVAEHGSSVAFPTRTLYFEGDVARKLAGPAEDRS